MNVDDRLVSSVAWGGGTKANDTTDLTNIGSINSPQVCGDTSNLEDICSFL